MAPARRPRRPPRACTWPTISGCSHAPSADRPQGRASRPPARPPARATARASSPSFTPPPEAAWSGRCSTRSGTSSGPARSRTTPRRRSAPSSGSAPSARRAPAAAPRRPSARGDTRPPAARRPLEPASRPRAGREGRPRPPSALLARAEQLLARHGVLTRDAIAASRRARRLRRPLPGAAQRSRSRDASAAATSCAASAARSSPTPGALERLRALRETSAGDDGDGPPRRRARLDRSGQPLRRRLALARGRGARPMRAAGTHVVLVDGALAAYLGRGEKELRTFLPADEPQRSRVLRGLAAGPRRLGRRGPAGRPSAGPRPMPSPWPRARSLRSWSKPGSCARARAFVSPGPSSAREPDAVADGS